MNKVWWEFTELLDREVTNSHGRDLPQDRD